MSENTTSGFDTAVAVFAKLEADTPGATRESRSVERTEAEGDEPEALDEESAETPEQGDEPDTDADDESAADEDDHAGDQDEDDDADTDGATREDDDAKDAEQDRLRYADYTRKAQALAEERKAFQAEVQAVREERASYGYLLTQLAQQVAEVPLPTAEQLAHLRETNPQAWLVARQEITDLANRRAAIQAEQERIAQDAEVERHQEFQATVSHEYALLLQKRPEWSNQEVFKKVQKELRAFGRDVMGFSEEELNQATDHRALLALHDAMQNHKLKKIKAEPLRSSTKTIKPGSANATPRQKTALDEAIKRQSKNGSTQNTAAVFRQLGI